MKILEVPKGSYGEATNRVNDVLRLVANMQFFRRHGSVPGSIVHLVEKHVAQYTQVVDHGQVGEPAIVLGGERTLRELRARITSEPGGEEFADRWNARLGRFLQQATDNAMKDPTIRERIGPPLWPVPRMANVVQPLAVDDPAMVLKDMPTSYRDLWWELACEVDKRAWNALLWETVVGQQPGEPSNPFIPLVQLHAEGFYPLGFLGQLFVVFGVSESPSIK
jgi:hypothetical protein